MSGLAQSGTLVNTDPLQPTGKQVNGTEMIVTDGAFMSSGKSVGGYLIVKAKHIDEAAETSKGCPVFKENGKVEVRPIQKMEM